jgi:hypothetical protein
MLAGALLAAVSHAQLLDDIEARSDQGIAEIRLQFTVPVRYIKHFPAEYGDLIKLYLQVLSLDGVEEMDLQEHKRIPKIPLVPPFTVAYSTARTCLSQRLSERDLSPLPPVRDPLCLDIQFNKPVRFNVRQGVDGRSILLHVLPDSESSQSPAAKPGKR